MGEKRTVYELPANVAGQPCAGCGAPVVWVVDGKRWVPLDLATLTADREGRHWAASHNERCPQVQAGKRAGRR